MAAKKATAKGVKPAAKKDGKSTPAAGKKVKRVSPKKPSNASKKPAPAKKPANETALATPISAKRTKTVTPKKPTAAAALERSPPKDRTAKRTTRVAGGGQSSASNTPKALAKVHAKSKKKATPAKSPVKPKKGTAKATAEAAVKSKKSKPKAK